MNKETKKCYKCKQDLTLDNFYKKGNQLDKQGNPLYVGCCKTCTGEYNRERYHIQKRNNPNLNSDRHKANKKQVIKEFNLMMTKYNQPNTFVTEDEREGVSLILTTLGWKFNKTTERWYKPGMVDKQGNWYYVVKKQKEELSKVMSKFSPLDKIKFENSNDDAEKLQLCANNRLTKEEIKYLLPKVKVSQINASNRAYLMRIRKNIDPQHLEDIKDMIDIDKIRYLLDKGYSVQGILPYVEYKMGKVYKLMNEYGIKKPRERC